MFLLKPPFPQKKSMTTTVYLYSETPIRETISVRSKLSPTHGAWFIYHFLSISSKKSVDLVMKAVR